MGDAQELLSGLDEMQRSVATQIGPVAVIAGAGSGKTRAITHRIAYQIATGGYQAQAVLALTFTNRAAGELRQRLGQLGVPRVAARTFHSAALKQASYFWPRAFGTALPQLTSSRSSLLMKCVGQLGLPDTATVIRQLDTEVSWAKVNNVLPVDYPKRVTQLERRVAGLDPEEIGVALGRYENLKSAHGLIDFDDILLCCCALLAENRGVAEEIRNTYRHFVVDEYQDVSPLQQSLLKLWLGQSSDLCVVGDPAQTIHSFAGANSRYLTEFELNHPQAHIFELSRDYRSTPEVVSLANQVAELTKIKAVKLQSARDSHTSYQQVAYDSEVAEAAGVAQWFQSLHEQGVSWSQMAVLYRIHSQSEVLEQAFTQAGIGFVRPGADIAEGESEHTLDRCVFTTLHSAKGLEWDAVAIIGAQEGLLPFVLAESAAEIAEEARLFYVGITRARTWLSLSWARSRAGEPVSVSRYIPTASSGPLNRPQRKKYHPVTALTQVCRICGKRLRTGSEQLIRRHFDCPASYDEFIYSSLQSWRQAKALKLRMMEFAVLSDAMLVAIAESIPDSLDGLRELGLANVRCLEYGEEILQILRNEPIEGLRAK